MRIVLEVTLEGNVNLPISADMEAFSDMGKLANKITQVVAGVRKVLPDIASRKVEKASAYLERSEATRKRRTKAAAAAAA